MSNNIQGIWILAIYVISFMNDVKHDVHVNLNSIILIF